MTSETVVKKNIQKLQRAIVDGLEDVKGQDIQVFNTEGLSPLFERVIVASGTSNRQTKALAASVRDAVREAGFDKPRMEGEENGEWIIVDCGQAVVHVMQPSIRQYYRLEDIWGEKPVRMKHGDAKGKPARAAAPEPDKTPAKKAPAKKVAAKAEPARKPAAAKKPAARAAAKPAAKKVAGKSAAAKSAVAKKAPAKKAPTKVAVVKVGVPAKKTVAKSAAKAGKPAAKAAAKPKAKPKKAA
jgi:ribosome-associated protein